MISIRRLRPGEASLFKQLRLRSLHDAAEAFSSTYASALLRSDESWREQADSTALGIDQATFIAFAEDEPIGIAALYRLNLSPQVGELIQVWVDPQYRGSEVAWTLLNAIFSWASENNFQTVVARVASQNTRALKFYLRYGFSVVEDNAYIEQGMGSVVLVKEVAQE